MISTFLKIIPKGISPFLCSELWGKVPLFLLNKNSFNFSIGPFVVGKSQPAAALTPHQVFALSDLKRHRLACNQPRSDETNAMKRTHST